MATNGTPLRLRARPRVSVVKTHEDCEREYQEFLEAGGVIEELPSYKDQPSRKVGFRTALPALR